MKKLLLSAIGFLVITLSLSAQELISQEGTAATVRLGDGTVMTVDFYGPDIVRIFVDPTGGPVRDPETTPPAKILVDNPRIDPGRVRAMVFGEDGVRIDTVSGEVELYACNCGDLSVTSSSGDQRLSELQAGKTQLQAVSGEIRLSAATLRELRIETSSGDVHLEAAVSRGHAQIRTVSGEVHLQDADAATMEIRTSSGNVRGSIRTEKDFRVETSSGDVYTSGSRRGAGECYVVTSSGDVHLTAGG